MRRRHSYARLLVGGLRLSGTGFRGGGRRGGTLCVLFELLVLPGLFVSGTGVCRSGMELVLRRYEFGGDSR